MTKPKTHFEQIPILKVKDMIATNLKLQADQFSPVISSAILQCRICARPVPVETAKTDSEGKAIHETCYLVSLAKTTASPLARRGHFAQLR